jgi:hypothetical protein
LGVIRKTKNRTHAKKTVVALNVKRNLDFSRSNLLNDFLKAIQDHEKPISSVGLDLPKLKHQHALFAKILATGLLSVLCDRNPNSKQRS